jgi:hypothetical protein
MSVEQKQLKNLRNRTLDLVRKSAPEKLVRLAMFLHIKVSDELVKKYTKKV